MKFAHGHPVDDQHALADWMKYPSVAEMNKEHDDVHGRLCNAMGVPSYSLLKASGKQLTPAQEDLAACEEAAVLHVQRWLQWVKVDKGE